jgi:predicted phage tail protein
MMKEGFKGERDLLEDKGAVRKTREYKQKHMHELKADLNRFKSQQDYMKHLTEEERAVYLKQIEEQNKKLDEEQAKRKAQLSDLDQKTSSRMRNYAEYLIHHKNGDAQVWDKFVRDKEREDEVRFQTLEQKKARDKRATFEYMKQAYDKEIRNKVPSRVEVE